MGCLLETAPPADSLFLAGQALSYIKVQRHTRKIQASAPSDGTESSSGLRASTPSDGAATPRLCRSTTAAMTIFARISRVPSAVTGHRPDISNALVMRLSCIVRPSTTGLHTRPYVTRGLVNVFNWPVQQRYVGRARHHDEFSVEAALQDEPGPGNVRRERDDNHTPPAVSLG
jgi:hypothetical protein